MNTSIEKALVLSLAMALVIFFCRVFPFLFSPLLPKDKTSGSKISDRVDGKAEGRAANAFLDFVERVAPPAAMTVLAFNALGPSIRTLLSAVYNAASAMPGEDFFRAAAVIGAITLTALTHIWKRNSLLSIFGGTAVYMILDRIISYRY